MNPSARTTHFLLVSALCLGPPGAAGCHDDARARSKASGDVDMFDTAPADAGRDAAPVPDTDPPCGECNPPPTCTEQPGEGCVRDCASSAIEAWECDRAGMWQCPENTIPVASCPVCPTELCCDNDGRYVEESGCDGVCPDGLSVETCGDFVPAGDLGGTWRELAWVLCGTGERVVPNDPIAELIMGGNTYMLTYDSGLFETYRDFWGDYTFDYETGMLSMTIDTGNFIPEPTDLRGWALEEGDQVRLVDMLLGDKGGPGGMAICGHIIERY